MAAGRALYRALMRTSQRFANYNFRSYARDRVRSEFRVNQAVTDAEKVRRLRDEAVATLGMLQRQTAISRMYAERPLVIEHKA